MQCEQRDYRVGDNNFKAFVAFDDAIDGPRPAIMIAHAFEGRNDLMCDHAKVAAEKGFVGVAIDMYGEAQIGADLEACLAHMMPCFEDRSLLRERVVAGFELVKAVEGVDPNNIFAIGFCFGGMCVLDLARSGVNVKGVCSVHGVLAAPGIACAPITAKVLALHGYQDPQVGPDALAPFAEEMMAAGVDWQLHYYGNAKHAFTDPDAAKIGPPELGRVYSARATERAWRSFYDFVAEEL